MTTLTAAGISDGTATVVAESGAQSTTDTVRIGGAPLRFGIGLATSLSPQSAAPPFAHARAPRRRRLRYCRRR